jgi:hypothetical protein
MILQRAWCMPRHKTFEIKPIRELLQKYNFDDSWADPFPYPYKRDALEYMQSISSESIQGAVFDPPYSGKQLKEMYESIGKSVDSDAGYWAKCRDEVSRIIKPDGICISFGWNSTGITKSRGFEIIEILLVAHGGQHNDTICTVEKKCITFSNECGVEK